MAERTKPASPKGADDQDDYEKFLIEAVLRARSGLRFGSIEITVHEGKVTQIERREKFRLQT